MSDIDYNEYTRMVNTTLLLQMNEPSSEQWRRGQAYFNVLHDVRPDLARQVRGTIKDPFYDDRRVPKFLAWVCLHWGGEEDKETDEPT